MNTEGKLIAERLREQRQDRQMSLRVAAEHLGISKTYLSDLERGVNEPNVWPLLGDLARLYRTSADYLLGLVDEPETTSRREALLPEAWELQEILQQLSPELRADIVVLARAILATSHDNIPRVFTSNDVLRPGHIRLIGERSNIIHEDVNFENKYSERTIVLTREESVWLKAGVRVVEHLKGRGYQLKKDPIATWMEFVVYQGLLYSQPRYYFVLFHWLSDNLKDAPESVNSLDELHDALKEILNEIEKEDFTR